MNTSILTRQIGPLPGWAWGGLVAVAAWWLFLRGKGASSSGTTNAAASGSALDSGYSLGYAQGVQANPPAAAQTGQPGRQLTIRPATTSGPAAPYDAQNSGVPVRAQPGPSAVIGTVPFGSTVTAAGAQVTGQPSETGNPIWWPVTYGGSAGYINAFDVANAVGGAIGGALRKHSIGARSSAPVWHDAHPLVGAPVRYAHYVRAVGGPANHRSEVARVARQSGVHPARVAMLNPEYTGRIRVA